MYSRVRVRACVYMCLRAYVHVCTYCMVECILIKKLEQSTVDQFELCYKEINLI